MTTRFGVAVFSIAAHIALGAFVIAMSLLSSDTLPTPRRVLAFEFHELVNLARDIELPAARPSPTELTPSNSNPTVLQPAVPAAPVVAPPGVQPETLLNETTASARSSAGVDAVEARGTGFVDGIGVTELPPPIVAPTAPIRLHSGMAAPRKVHDVMPIYPAMARTARVQGVVILEAVIDVSGRVESARVLRSIALLDVAALEAVRQWRFDPARLNGQPVPVVMTVTVNFALQ